MTATPAPEKYSDEMLDIILNHASSPSCCASKSSLREYIPTLVAMAKHGQKSRNAYTTNLIAERDDLKKQLGAADAAIQHWGRLAARRSEENEILKREHARVLARAADISTVLTTEECAAAAYVDKVFASVSKLRELKTTIDENESLKKQLEVALASERDKVNRVILHKQENTALKQELQEAKAELLRLQEYFNLQRALEEASSIAAVTGELKHSLYVLERTDGSIVTHGAEGSVHVLVLKSFNAACEAIDAMRKPKYPHPSYHITLVTEAQVKQLKSQIPLLLSAGEPLRLVPNTA